MVKFTIEEIREIMDRQDNIRNMSVIGKQSFSYPSDPLHRRFPLKNILIFILLNSSRRSRKIHLNRFLNRQSRYYRLQSRRRSQIYRY